MHSFLSSLVSFFLSPLNWLFVLLVVACCSPKSKWRKTMLITALSIFLLFGNGWLLNLYARNWQPAPVELRSLGVYSCGIVAGGFGSPDASANGYFNETSDRFIQILKLYKNAKIKHIFISGGNGKPDINSFREGAWAKKELIQMGVPDSVIFLEDYSSNTAENALNTKKVMDSLHFAPPYLLVTSAYHMPRASLVFKKAGLDVDCFPCNYISGRGKTMLGDFIPQLSVLSGWNTYLKETVGYWWYRMK